MITNKQKRYAYLFVGYVALVGLFQNFDFANMNFNLKPVDQESRVVHAKELLGKSYKGSNAQRAEKLADLHISIQETLMKNLPKEYKKISPQLAQVIIDESEFYDFDPIFVLAMIRTESSFNPKARGQFTEIGLMQIKPETARWICDREGLVWKGSLTLEDPIENVKIGMAYVNYLRNSFDRSASKYLAAYNMGSRNVRRLYASEKRPKEYATRVMKHYYDLYDSLTAFKLDTQIAGN